MEYDTEEWSPKGDDEDEDLIQGVYEQGNMAHQVLVREADQVVAGYDQKWRTHEKMGRWG